MLREPVFGVKFLVVSHSPLEDPVHFDFDYFPLPFRCVLILPLWLIVPRTALKGFVLVREVAMMLRYRLLHPVHACHEIEIVGADGCSQYEPLRS